ncbi:MAG: tetratricopeptide repeat protein [Flavobacteriales bacterium]|nr:tetratricopeptide repeat protein [Flavobacteriales bacterium]|tara:strand:+ start:1868 stop:2551 length:684 start_codon:yes stop_codon:yes gene_type:complete
MEKKNVTEKQLANLEEGLSKAEQFVENNRKSIFSIIGIIILAFILFYSYNNLYIKPLNEKAQKQLFIAERFFEQDSFKLALNGNEDFLGFIDIIDKYSKTKSASLAKYYAGISFYKTSNYPDAIKTLEKFNSQDKLLLSIAKITIGDAFSDLNQPEEALEYYLKSMDVNKNNLITPIVLMKCSKIYESLNKSDKAIDCYNEIKSNYPDSKEALNIDKNINKLINENK